jgi:hypothetical protein
VADEDVIRLDIAVDEAGLPHGTQCIDRLRQQVGRPLQWQSPAIPQQTADWHSVDVFRHQIWPARIKAEIDEAEHLGVLDAGQCRGFSPHLTHRGCAVEHTRPVDDLDRNGLICLLVTRLEHEARRAGTEGLCEQEMVDTVTHLGHRSVAICRSILDVFVNHLTQFRHLPDVFVLAANRFHDVRFDDRVDNSFRVSHSSWPVSWLVTKPSMPR